MTREEYITQPDLDIEASLLGNDPNDMYHEMFSVTDIQSFLEQRIVNAVQRKKQNRTIRWKTKDGRKIQLFKMDTQHVKNALAFCYRNAVHYNTINDDLSLVGALLWFIRFYRELEHRGVILAKDMDNTVFYDDIDGI